MALEVIGAAMAVVGTLLWIRRGMRHDLTALRSDMAALRSDLTALRSDLTAQVTAVNTRIDNILLADRGQKAQR